MAQSLRFLKKAAVRRFIVFAAATDDQESHPDAYRVPAGGTELAEVRMRRRCFVEMEGLWIEARGEVLDLVGSKGVTAERRPFAYPNVLEKFHDGRGAFCADW